ncbi:MAG: toll/interleukin-1 receptor domain-containing protein [Opitutales bacterium]
MSSEPFTPLVFISYSHDSREHKQWVLELAQELRGSHGVEVIIDQWDLEPGDDLPRFMREAVNRCDRVLMICTEKYVDKADAGKGGVGYEAMIVDGELIKDLGTNKFIPIIRQAGSSIRLPQSVGTRLGANLSDGSDHEEEMKTLIEKLHNVPPPSKPPLAGGPLKSAPALKTSVMKPDEFPSDPSDLYDAALELARSGDMVSWRRLIQEKKSATLEPLRAWRAEWEQRRSEINDKWIECNVDGLKAIEPVFAVAMAGIESGVDKFNRQSSLVHDLLEPKSWEHSGLVFFSDFPQTATLTFQSLVGIFSIHTEQASLVFGLANQRIKKKYDSESTLLWNYSKVIGWPESLGGRCNNTWKFLWELPENIPWIAEKLGSVERYRECICGHYFMLSFVEFIDTFRASPEKLKSEDPDLAIPTYFLHYSELSVALREILYQKDQLLDYIKRQGIKPEDLRNSWPKWMKQCKIYLGQIGSRWDRGWVGDSYTHFMEDLLR